MSLSPVESNHKNNKNKKLLTDNEAYNIICRQFNSIGIGGKFFFTIINLLLAYRAYHRILIGIPQYLFLLIIIIYFGIDFYEYILFICVFVFIAILVQGVAILAQVGLFHPTLSDTQGFSNIEEGPGPS